MIGVLLLSRRRVVIVEAESDIGVSVFGSLA
jgi:hypothetical protein